MPPCSTSAGNARNSKFSPLCAHRKMASKAPKVLIFRLLVTSDQANSQIQSQQMVRTSCNINNKLLLPLGSEHSPKGLMCNFLASLVMPGTVMSPRVQMRKQACGGKAPCLLAVAEQGREHVGVGPELPPPHSADRLRSGVLSLASLLWGCVPREGHAVCPHSLCHTAYPVT